LISSEGSGDLHLIRKLNSVLFSWREKALKQCDGGVKRNTTFATNFDTGVDLIKVDKVVADTLWM
jgi:hypothetical protein